MVIFANMSMNLISSKTRLIVLSANKDDFLLSFTIPACDGDGRTDGQTDGQKYYNQNNST